jgi:hypothetical protein
MIRQATLPMVWVFLLGSMSVSDAQKVSQPPANFPGGSGTGYPVVPLIGATQHVGTTAATQVALTTGNYANVASAVVAAGNYLTFGTCEMANSSTTTLTAVACVISNVGSNVAPGNPAAGPNQALGATFATGGNQEITSGIFSFSASSAGTFWLNCFETFGTSTASCYGTLTVIQLP